MLRVGRGASCGYGLKFGAGIAMSGVGGGGAAQQLVMRVEGEAEWDGGEGEFETRSVGGEGKHREARACA